VTSKLLVCPVRSAASLGFPGVGIHVVGQFRICNREARRRRLVRPGGKLPVKPARTNLRPILIAHAMRHKSSIVSTRISGGPVMLALPKCR
jgi:hypothetical protein